jgi:hypothetical protein
MDWFLFLAECIYHRNSTSDSEIQGYFTVTDTRPVLHRGAPETSEASQPHVDSIGTTSCQLGNHILPSYQQYFHSIFGHVAIMMPGTRVLEAFPSLVTR